MMDDIERIKVNSSKAEILEAFTENLAVADKAMTITVCEKDNGKYRMVVSSIGIEYEYEKLGILEDAKTILLE